MKKNLITLLIISIFLIGKIPVYASTNTFNRNELENYGVNKDWNITSENLDNVLRTKAVDASEKVYDFADLLTEEEEQTLYNRILEFIENTNMDMAIVTDRFSYINDNENERYADDFYDYNDFGMNYPYNSGVLLLRNAYSENPYYHMSTTGNAQLYLSDSRIEDILDGIYEDIRSENYLDAFMDFVDCTESYIKEGKPSTADNYYIDENGNIQEVPEEYSIPWGICSVISLVITAIIMGILIAKNKMVRKAKSAETYLDKQSINITNRKDVFITSHTSSYRISSDSGSSSSGGHSSHMGSSGGSHGGGGRHG